MNTVQKVLQATRKLTIIGRTRRVNHGNLRLNLGMRPAKVVQCAVKRAIDGCKNGALHEMHIDLC